jgi:hypothetical protein
MWSETAGLSIRMARLRRACRLPGNDSIPDRDGFHPQLMPRSVKKNATT